MTWNNILPASLLLDLLQNKKSNLEVEAYEGELKELRELKTLYSKIFTHSFAADKVGDVYFICGESGEKDQNGLPNHIWVCPAYGVDWFQVYTKTQTVVSPEY